MAALFVIVGKNEPVYEAELGAAAKVSPCVSGSRCVCVCGGI